jgi:signal transduction histidine kinase
VSRRNEVLPSDLGRRPNVLPDDGNGGSRRSFWSALSCWALSLTALGVSVGYARFHRLPASAANFSAGPGGGVLAVVFVGAFATVGALLVWKKPANPIGWLLSAVGLAFAVGGVGLLLAYFRPLLPLAHWFGWIWLFGLSLTVPILLLFPTGGLPSRRWRPAAWAAYAGPAAWVIGNAFAPTIITATPARIRNPIGIHGAPGAIFPVVALAGALLIVGAGLAAVASLALRYRRSQLVQREQLKWLLYTSGLIVAAVLAEIGIQKVMGSGPASVNLQNAISSGAVALVPVAIGIAVFRYRLYDIDLVINKTLVYGSLAAFITGVYVAIVVGIGSLVSEPRAHQSLLLPILATAVVALAFQPVRERVQRLANRLVYGSRATPYEVLAQFAERMGGTYATEELLPRMAQLLAEGTAAGRVDVWLAGGGQFRNDASWPPGVPPFRPISADAPGGELTFPGADRIVPVLYRGETLGALSLTKRPGESLTPTEGKLLLDLAAQIGLVLHNVGLWEQLTARLEDLHASRQRLVAAQDAERRRIERNIHDGAQQQLVSLAIKLSLAESMVGSDDEGEREMLGELHVEAIDAVEDLRDLARGIYPPLLVADGLAAAPPLLVADGLAAALRPQVAKSAVPAALDGGGIGRYPREIEAAAYFCVLEALQNMSKYSRATSASVQLRAGPDGELLFEVTDDGVGFDPAASRFGSGLQGIEDRLGTHGGTLQVISSPGAGTVIRGQVPAADPSQAAA